MTIRVEQRHIENGRRRTACACPIALAIMDGVAGATAVSVGPSDLYVYANGQTFTEDLPISARQFIRSFDDMEPVQPFTFEIAIP